jgi:hypothetical protein
MKSSSIETQDAVPSYSFSDRNNSYGPYSSGISANGLKPILCAMAGRNDIRIQTSA